MAIGERMPEDPSHFTMSLGDHLDELRRRVFKALIVPLPLSVVLFFFADIFVEWLLVPLQNVQLAWGFRPEVQVLSPPEFLLLELKLSLVLALVLSLPWILWQAWQFIGPGLYPRERRFVYLLLPGSFLLTIAGICVMYFIMLPLMLQVLMLITRGIDVPAQLLPATTGDTPAALVIPMEPVAPEHAAPGQMWLGPDQRMVHVAVTTDDSASVQVLQIPLQGRAAVAQVFRLASYINFVLALLLGISLAFQLPLVLLLGGWLGLLNTEMLRRKRKWALMVCAVIAAITTPADVFSMIMMLIPLYFLYELGILLITILPAHRLAGNAEGRPRDGDEAA